ncbi:hypothetical protein ACIA8G_41770 [Lentzea sp. NPDC051213]|uniref:hypothetical protein n=1 Tax=Lentzea sp. NPDC051213 TaxID=3364126 RepID=UPI0037A3FBC2
MNEEDLKRAFQNVVVASSPPPAMDPGIALDVARKARSRRRSSITGAAVAVLVVGIGIGSAFALNPKGAKEYMLGAGPSSSSSAANAWPDGQTDRTSHNGPQADRATKLLGELKAVVPAGYTTPKLKYLKPEYNGADMEMNQAQVASDKGDPAEVWEYLARVAVQKGDGVGSLVAQVSTPNPRASSDVCTISKEFWGIGGACKIVTAKGQQVGVTTSAAEDAPFDQVATFRSPDGTTVTIGQDAEFSGSGHPALAAGTSVFNEEQLASLAADPRFLVAR